MNFIWVADFDRRFGITPTPGNIIAILLDLLLTYDLLFIATDLFNQIKVSAT